MTVGGAVVARIVDSTAALDAKRAEVSVQFSEKTDAFAVGDVPCKEIFTEATLIDVLGTGSACYWRSATELVVRLGVPGDADGRSDSLCALAQLGDRSVVLHFVEGVVTRGTLSFDDETVLPLPRSGPFPEPRLTGASTVGLCSPLQFAQDELSKRKRAFSVHTLIGTSARDPRCLASGSLRACAASRRPTRS